MTAQRSTAMACRRRNRRGSCAPGARGTKHRAIVAWAGRGRPPPVLVSVAAQASVAACWLLRPAAALFAIVWLSLMACTALAAPDAYQWHVPRGFPTPAVPADNPMSVPKVALGRRLFFEPRLSVTGKYSCTSCHEPARAYTDGRALAVGATGETLTRSAMSLINVAYNISYGWTKPEVQSLEAQMLEPLLNEHPVELGLAGRQAEVCELLAHDPIYRAAFAESFPDEAAPVTFENLVKAIAAFERTLIYGDSPFDRYVFGGDHAAISAQAKRGMQLFYSPRAACGACHSGFNFSGQWRDAEGATGQPSMVSNGTSDRPIRVPTLRNITLTAPYMHDGRFATLDAVLDHYARVAKLPDSDSRLRTFNLSTDERADLIAFLNTLTDPKIASDSYAAGR